MMKFTNNYTILNTDTQKYENNAVLYDHSDIKKLYDEPEDYFDAIDEDFIPVLRDDRGKTYYIVKTDVEE